MSWYLWDEDEYETVYEFNSYGEMNGVPVGTASIGQRRRAPEEIIRIKAEKRRAYEDDILKEAEAIRKRRAIVGAR